MTDLLNSTLATLQHCIETSTFIDVEKPKIEVKAVSSSGNWKSLKQSVCAFLNTQGGYVICGIKEEVTGKEKRYKLTGFDKGNENNLLELQNKIFKTDLNQLIDLSAYISFDYRDFLDQSIAIIYVKALSDDLKYVHLDGGYYERILNSDTIISDEKFARHREYKQMREYARELSIVDAAVLKDLNIDKVNKYINLINAEIKQETLKASIAKAKPFLVNQHFVKDEQVTTLGMLVCGDDPFHFLENRVEVDCWYDTSADIGKDKKIFRNDVISLMEDAFKYVWGNIKIARTYDKGGSQRPEYPEKLIRETINNALAHRDYSVNHFISINIEPGQFIEIKNPGSFKAKMKIVHTSSPIPVRRLIPGIPESKNPKLASVLKVFDKIESQGRGMASLVNFTMENLIDIPYYEIKDDSQIILRLPSGKLLDTTIDSWLSGFELFIAKRLRGNLDEEQKKILAYFYKTELLNRRRFFTILLHESNNHFQQIESLKNAGLLLEHEAGNDNNPVYVVARELMKTNYDEELMALLGDSYIQFSSFVKTILNILYRHTYYNEKAVKPSDIAISVYEKEYGISIDPKQFESMGRKIRSACQKLHEQNILTKHENNTYKIKI